MSSSSEVMPSRAAPRRPYRHEQLFGGHAVKSSSPEAILSRAAPRRPYRHEQLFGGHAVKSCSTEAIPSRAAHRRPYRQEHLTGGHTAKSSSPEAIPPRAAHRRPYCQEQLPRGHTVKSSSLEAIPSRTTPRRPYRQEQLPRGHTVKSSLPDCRNLANRYASADDSTKSLITLHRFSDHVNDFLSPSQSGFRRGRSTTDVVWGHRWLAEKCQRYKYVIEILGIDFSLAFDTIRRKKLLDVLSSSAVSYAWTRCALTSKQCPHFCRLTDSRDIAADPDNNK